MGNELEAKRRPTSKNSVRAMLRRATSLASNTRRIDGKRKGKGGARPVSLPQIKFTEIKD